MVTVYISQSPGGILKTMEKILGNGVTVRAGTSTKNPKGEQCYIFCGPNHDLHIHIAGIVRPVLYTHS